MRIPIGKIAQHLGINIHLSTAIRWHNKGVMIGGRRVVLPATRFGCRLYVDEGDLKEFIEKLNDRPVQTLEEKPASPKSGETGQLLDKFGI